FAVDGDDLEVVQRGGTVLLFDQALSRLDVVDPATATVADSVPLPPRQPRVLLAGEHVVVFEQGTGEVRFTELPALTGFDAEAPPALSLGADALVSVAPDGVMFAYAPSAGLLYRVDARGSGTVLATSAIDL